MRARLHATGRRRVTAPRRKGAMRSRALRSRVLGIALGAGALSLGLHAPTVAVAQQAAAPPLAGADLLAALRAGGNILYFRHADTDHSQVDRRGRLRGCTTQRNPDAPR